MSDAQNKATTVLAMDASHVEAAMTRDAADDALNEAILKVVDGVKGDIVNHGANSPLYKAMGYVPRSERSSGLTRRGTATANTGGNAPVQATWSNVPGTFSNPLNAPAANTPVTASAGG